MEKSKKNDSPQMVTVLDCAIRDYEVDGNTSKYGYKINGREAPYDNYMSYNTWKTFLKGMSRPHRQQFEDGDGGETKEKKGRWGLCPPKMASYGSSSRFIYNLSKDICGFRFEKQLPTRVGHTANLDGFLPKKNINVYVEAKCREIYGKHKRVEVSEVYKEVYEFIHNKKHIDFDYKDNKLHCKKKEHFNCTFKYKGVEIVHFDLKQLICHFLGITADILENKRSEKVRFVYLIYNPQKVKEKIDYTYREAILSAYDETIAEIKRMGDMNWLFKAVLDYQQTNLNISIEKVPSFEFKLVDQDSYRDELEL